jgi:hypothetical protein
VLCAPGRWPRRRRAQWPSYRRWLPKLSTLNRQKFVARDSHTPTCKIRLQHSAFRDVHRVENDAVRAQARKLFFASHDDARCNATKMSVPCTCSRICTIIAGSKQ